MAEQNLTPLPEGVEESEVVKPVTLAKELGIKPQMVYGYIRNGGLPAHTKPDGDGNQTGRYILRTEFAEWQEEKAAKKAEREQRKADKEAKAAEKADAAESESETEEAEDYA